MTFTFEHHLKALVYLHLQEYESGRELLQVLEQDEFARTHIAPPQGVSRSTFFEAMNTRGLEQLSQMYHLLQAKAKALLPALHSDLGEMVGIDGSLIDAVPTMQFADYRNGVQKAKVHMGLDLNRGIPQRVFLSAGKADDEDPCRPGQTFGCTPPDWLMHPAHRRFDPGEPGYRPNGLALKGSVVLDAGRNTLTSRFVDEHGQVLDSFTITR